MGNDQKLLDKGATRSLKGISDHHEKNGLWEAGVEKGRPVRERWQWSKQKMPTAWSRVVSRDDEKAPDCACILNIQVTGYADEFGVVWERKRVKNGFIFLT